MSTSNLTTTYLYTTYSKPDTWEKPETWELYKLSDVERAFLGTFHVLSSLFTLVFNAYIVFLIAARVILNSYILNSFLFNSYI